MGIMSDDEMVMSGDNKNGDTLGIPTISCKYLKPIRLNACSNPPQEEMHEMGGK